MICRATSLCSGANLKTSFLSCFMIFWIVLLQRLHTPSKRMICLFSGKITITFLFLFFSLLQFQLIHRDRGCENAIVLFGITFFYAVNTAYGFTVLHSHAVSHF